MQQVVCVCVWNCVWLATAIQHKLQYCTQLLLDQMIARLRLCKSTTACNNVRSWFGICQCRNTNNIGNNLFIIKNMSSAVNEWCQTLELSMQWNRMCPRGWQVIKSYLLLLLFYTAILCSWEVICYYRFFILLFYALGPNHCTLVACDSKWVTSLLWRVFE